MSPNPGQWPWSELEMGGPPEDPREVRRAYARKLKTIDANEDIEAFEALRSAYEAARAFSGGKPRNHHNKFAPGAQFVQLAPTHPKPATPPDQPRTDVVDGTTPNREHNPGHSPEPSPQKPAASPWGRGSLFSSIEAVIARAQELIKNRDLRDSSWEPLFFSNALDDTRSARVFESGLIDILTRLHSDNRITSFNRDFVELADRRFGWVSDGIGFLNRYPNARGLQQVMSRAIRQSAPRIVVDPRGKPIPPLVWVVPFLIWLFMLQHLY